MDENRIQDAECHASRVAKKMVGAFWSDSNREYLVEQAVEDLKKLAIAFGFDLTPRHCPLTETISHAEAAQ